MTKPLARIRPSTRSYSAGVGTRRGAMLHAVSLLHNHGESFGALPPPAVWYHRHSYFLAARDAEERAPSIRLPYGFRTVKLLIIEIRTCEFPKFTRKDSAVSLPQRSFRLVCVPSRLFGVSTIASSYGQFAAFALFAPRRINSERKLASSHASRNTCLPFSRAHGYMCIYYRVHCAEKSGLRGFVAE